MYNILYVRGTYTGRSHVRYSENAQEDFFLVESISTRPTRTVYDTYAYIFRHLEGLNTCSCRLNICSDDLHL